MPLPTGTYDITQSYEWNYEHGPVFEGVIPERAVNPTYDFLGFKLNAPLGVPAGPLLSSKYIALYSQFGFDVLSYKTVRSVQRISHPAPNCLYIGDEFIDPRKQGERAFVVEEPRGMHELSITNSFGMPSMAPEIWQPDVEKANDSIGEGQVLIVSIVGTKVEEREYIDDWAYVASMAKEAGGQIIELDISCPNVTGGAGQIFQDSELTREIVERVRGAIGNTPLLLKIGYFEDENHLEEFVKVNGPIVEGIVAINTLRMKIVDDSGVALLPGEGREYAGVCGSAIRSAGLETVERLINNKPKFCPDLAVIGVGGIVEPAHFNEYFSAGADIAMSATGAMWNPYLANEFLEGL